MNEQLKFSWGHIIAFLALIAISYISFIGVTYLTEGDFTKAAITMVCIDLVLLFLFIGAQIAKATVRKFARWIYFERICVFCSPIVFILIMSPYFHFWTVHSQNNEIISDFTNAINASKQMFTDYEEYSNSRIKNYKQMLEHIISNKSTLTNELASCGFTPGKEQMQKDNMVRTLQLQLLSVNYNSLKAEATKWIDQSSDGVSTWNVFLLGNTKEIKKAIHEWCSQLSSFANNKLSNEEFNEYNKVETFEETSKSMTAVDNGLDSINGKFTGRGFPNIWSIISAILLYFALLFPYFLQDRHTKSQYRLIGMEKSVSQGDFIDLGKYSKQQERKDIKDKFENNISISSEDEDDDFASFTINK